MRNFEKLFLRVQKYKVIVCKRDRVKKCLQKSQVEVLRNIAQ